MKVELRNLINSDATIAAICGAEWAARVQGATGPAMVLHLVSGAEGLTQSGPDGVFEGRVQIDCYAEKYARAEELRGHLVRVLSGHRADGFLGIFHLATREGREANAAREFRISLDFMVYHRSE